ncbi:MAG: formylglycine-generating enzyme family protein [Planctomycetota bacterium]|nr:formylglycine-generating enzyme family protein [Planctomycetota bacterium]
MKRLLGLLLVMGMVGGDDAATPLPDPIENSIGVVLVSIPAGEFSMGSPEIEKELYIVPRQHEVQHRVTLTKPFLLGVHEVTHGQWQAVMGTTLWKGKRSVKEGDDHPATYVDWQDAVEFCRQLSEEEGLEYRLPTDAAGEYACRAGTTTPYSFGDDASELDEYSWYRENSQDVRQEYVHTVVQKLPNAWGLYDMHGNVFEWCTADRRRRHPPG